MFSHFFIDRPIFATVLSIVIVIVGSVALLGLPIAQRTAELHGGTLSVACPAGGGTVVTLTLPRRASGS